MKRSWLVVFSLFVMFSLSSCGGTGSPAGGNQPGVNGNGGPGSTTTGPQVVASHFRGTWVYYDNPSDLTIQITQNSINRTHPTVSNYQNVWTVGNRFYRQQGNNTFHIGTYQSGTGITFNNNAPATIRTVVTLQN